MNEKKLNRRRVRTHEPLMPGIGNKPQRSNSMEDYPDAVHHPGTDESVTTRPVATSPALELRRILSLGDNQEYDLEAAQALAKRWNVLNGTPTNGVSKNGQ